MADGSTQPGDSSTSSSGSSSDATLKKPKGVKHVVVQSRYMQQYEKKKVAKWVNQANVTICSSGKAPERTGSGTPTRRSMAPRMFKAPTGLPPGALDGTLFGEGDLQSTLLEGHKIDPPDLDLSVINDKAFQKKTPKAQIKADPKMPKKEQPPVLAVPEEVLPMCESQTVILTLLRVEMEKNIRRQEEKAERSLILVGEESEKRQKKLHDQRRKLLLQKREQQLEMLLASQAEVLMPSAAEDGRFKSEYRNFATALDSTRHELPIKNVHVPGNKPHYLEKLQEHLETTETLLKELMHNSSEENAKTLDATRDLEAAVLKLDKALPRTLTDVIDLAFKVSKETSLKNQEVFEGMHNVDIVKQWYFDEAFLPK